MTRTTHKTKAYLTEYSCATPQDLEAGNFSGVAYSTYDHSDSGWTFIGDAEITIDLVDRNALIENKVSALKAEAANIRAEATKKTLEIEDKIKKLLAISYDSTGAA